MIPSLSTSNTAAAKNLKQHLKANTSLSTIKFNNTPNLKSFFATKIDKDVWWHTQQRKESGQYISNPSKKWRPRKRSPRSSNTSPININNITSSNNYNNNSRKFKSLKVKIHNNNKVPRRPSSVNKDNLKGRRRPTPIRRKLRGNISPSNTLSTARSDDSFNSLDESDDSDDDNNFKALEAATVEQKYFKNNEKLTYIMEKMVSDLSAKVMKERQKNIKRIRGNGNKNGKKKKKSIGRDGDKKKEDFVEQAMAGIKTTLEQDDIIDTRYGLKRESKKIIAKVEKEISELSLELNTLLTKENLKKQELVHLETAYRNMESKIAMLIASLSIIEEKKKKLYARRDIMTANSSRVLAYQQTLEHMLKREKILMVDSKKKSIEISQKIKAVRRHYNSLYELGLEAKRMRNEVKLELEKLREQSKEQIHKLNIELEKDMEQSKKIIKIQDNVLKRKNNRKLIAAGHEFDKLEGQIEKNSKRRNTEIFGSIFVENPSAVQIRYGNRYFQFRELERILKKIHRVHNFSSGEISPEAWLVDIYGQEQTKTELETTIDKHEKTIKSKQEELEKLKSKALAISIESNNNKNNNSVQQKQIKKQDGDENTYDTTQIESQEQKRQYESPDKNQRKATEALANELLDDYTSNRETKASPSLDEATRSATNFIHVEQYLQDKLRDANVELDQRKNLVSFFHNLVTKVKIGIQSLQARVSRSDLPIPNQRAMLRGTQLPPVDQMELFREAIISIENEIRLNENIDATYRPKIKEGHLIYDEKVHERTDMGRYNSRVEKALRVDEDVATKDDLIIEKTLKAVNLHKRNEIKKRTRKTLRIEEKKKKANQRIPRSPKKKAKKRSVSPTLNK